MHMTDADRASQGNQMIEDEEPAYMLDRNALMLSAYQLLCYSYANREIARSTDPSQPDDPAYSLEQRFFGREVSRLLFQIAIGLRITDDRMNSLPNESRSRTAYLQRRESIDRRSVLAVFEHLNLHQVCNKIIHASIFGPHLQRGGELHAIDEQNLLAWSEVPTESSEKESASGLDAINWNHLSGFVRLGGRRGREQWFYFLDIRAFVDAVHELLDGKTD